MGHRNAGLGLTGLLALSIALALSPLAILGNGNTFTSVARAAPSPAPVLIISPMSAVPNQTILVAGTGFSTGGAYIAASSITVGGVAAIHNQVPVHTNGSFSLQITIPVNAATGSQAIAVTDSQGTSKTATVSIPGRSISLSSTSGVRGSVITATLAGFPSQHVVTVTYGGQGVVGSGLASFDGKSTVSFSVPPTALIPSTNTVTAVSGGNVLATATATHTIPDAKITVSPATGAANAEVTVAGTGFPPYSLITSLTFGGISALPLPTPVVDGKGTFTATFPLPSLPQGPTPLVVTAAGVSTVATFTTLAGTTTAALSAPQASAVFAPLETRSILEVVTTFDYENGVFLAYVPNLPGNTLKQIQPNSALFVTVSQDVTLSVSGKTFELKANVPTPVPMGALVSLIVLS